LDWGLSLAEGAQRWQDSAPLAWTDESRRFFNALSKFDQRLADSAPLACPAENLFRARGDALTHVGQIAMLRRIAGAPIKGENYFRPISPWGASESNRRPKRVLKSSVRQLRQSTISNLNPQSAIDQIGNRQSPFSNREGWLRFRP
jgi:hypothetical protein